MNSKYNMELYAIIIAMKRRRLFVIKVHVPCKLVYLIGLRDLVIVGLHD